MYTINASEYSISKHAESRMHQRGFSTSDVDLVRNYGTSVGDGSVLTNKDVATFKAEMYRKLQRLEQLTGTAVIEQELLILTMYRTDSRRLRKLLRNR